MFHGNHSDHGGEIVPNGYDIGSNIIGSNGVFSEDPRYVDTTDNDPTLWDLTLAAGSPLIDAGDPSVLDPDGSISDIGAYGGPSAW